MLVGGAVAVSVAAASSGSAPATRPAAVEVGRTHVHGLGVDPADGTLYAATHTGLLAVGEDGTATPVGGAQDTMGFTVTGPRTFLGSGHPDLSQDDEPLLGLIASRDAGRSWEPLSLRGEADFHALVARHGRVYGYDATTSTVMVSADRRTWDRRSRLPVRDLAVHPADPEGVLATTPQGLVTSGDGGRSWERVPQAPALVVLAWPTAGLLYGVDVAGTVHVSTDAGRTWQARGATGGAPEAVTSPDRQPDRLVVAVEDGRIVESTDGGRTFAVRYGG